MKLKLTKRSVGHVKCAEDVASLLKKAGFSIHGEKRDSNMLQFRVKKHGKDIGCLRFYRKKEGGVTIDDSQIKLESSKMKIRNLLDGYLDMNGFRRGGLSLPCSRSVKDSLLAKKIKEKLLDNFEQLKDSKQSDQIFNYKLEGPNLIISQYGAGSLLFQGKATKFSDRIIQFVDKILAENQKQYLLGRIKEQVPKEEFESIKEQLSKQIINFDDYVSKELYTSLSGCGSHLLHDGLLIFEIIKAKGVRLKDYGSIVRNFSMLFEDFLINWLISLGLVNEELFKQKPKYGYVGDILNKEPNELERRFGYLYRRTKPKFLEKLRSAYQECRHDLLHSDKFKYKPLNLKQAEIKKGIILECMEDCVDLFGDYFDRGSSTNEAQDIMGTDEAGKGDYFGPLVVAGVFVENLEVEFKLRNLGVKDSKKLNDARVKELAGEINKICKCNVVIISPEKYNQLYKKIKNLNTLLGWGHARVIENMLKTVKARCVISDKFGDESFIKSKLMKEGKKVNLIQEINAEQNVAVAAASILARNSFLEYMEKLSKMCGGSLPKGASEEVVEFGERIVKDKGKEFLNKIAKVHFKITERL